MTPYIGMISVFGFNFAPKGWAQCNGQIMPIAQNQALFSILGTTYGGDGITTFALPDLRGRSVVNWGTSTTGVNYTLGERAGSENVTLQVSNMPMHTHNSSLTLKASTNATGVTPDPTNNFFAPAADAIGNMYAPSPSGATLGNVSIQVNGTGGSQPLSVMNPYVVVNCCVALTGLYPSRN